MKNLIHIICLNIILISMVGKVEAQESHLTNLALSEGRYQINAAFSSKSEIQSSYEVNAGVGYFIRNDISLDGDLSVYTYDKKNIVTPGLGGTLFFLKSPTVAPFVAQKFSSGLDSDAAFISSTSFGALAMISQNFGFKPTAFYDQNFKDKTKSFYVSGSFTFIY